MTGVLAGKLRSIGATQAEAFFQETVATGKAGQVSEREQRFSVKAASVSDAEFLVAQVANLRYGRLPIYATTAARAALDAALGPRAVAARSGHA